MQKREVWNLERVRGKRVVMEEVPLKGLDESELERLVRG